MSTTPPTNHPTSMLLQQIQQAYTTHETVTIGRLLDHIGRRSFGPIILFIGAFLAVPGPSDIPTVPSIVGLLIILIGVQVIFNREHIWLPKWILRKSLKRSQLDTSIQRLQKPAEYVDRIVSERLTFLTSTFGNKVAATMCISLACLTPVMELIPFSANIAGVALVFFGLGFVGRDGLMHFLGYLFCCTLIGLGVWVFAL